MVNQKNIEIYQNGGGEDEFDEVYTCTVCGQKTCYSDSFSNKGAKLICRPCAEKKAKELGLVFAWDYVKNYIHTST